MAIGSAPMKSGPTVAGKIHSRPCSVAGTAPRLRWLRGDDSLIQELTSAPHTNVAHVNISIISDTQASGQNA